MQATSPTIPGRRTQPLPFPVRRPLGARAGSMCRRWIGAVLVSSADAAPVDTVLFLALAWGSDPGRRVAVQGYSGAAGSRRGYRARMAMTHALITMAQVLFARGPLQVIRLRVRRLALECAG